MTLTDLFSSLGAKLANQRWAWGGARDDGTIVLRAWQDEIHLIDGRYRARLTHHKLFVNDPDNLGFVERLRHVQLIEDGAEAFVVICKATDPKKMPRSIESFNSDFVYSGREVIKDEAGDSWLVCRQKLDVSEIRSS